MKTKNLKSAAILVLLLLSSLSVHADETTPETPEEGTGDEPVEEPEGGTEAEGETPEEEMMNALSSDDIYDPFLKASIGSPESPIKAKGSFQTSLYTGSATYTFPVEVPPGTNGLAPSIILGYNSQSAKRAEFTGLGWNLNLNYVQRDVNHTPENLDDDEFDLVLNGRKYDLVYVLDEGRYHTRVESYIYIEKKSGGSNQKGEYWIARTKDGTEYRFGYYGDGKPSGVPSSSEAVCSSRDYVWRWYLDQITDTHNNKIYLRYNQNPNPSDIGAVYPYEIVYNNDEGRVIEFVLEDSDRSDSITVYDLGCKIRESRMLKEVRVSANGNPVREYALDYSPDSVGTRSLLTSITEYGSDGTPLPSTTFEYQSIEEGWQLSEWNMPEGLANLQGRQGVRLTDVDGDGLPDILQGFVDKLKDPYEYKYYAWINNGHGWDEADDWKPPVYFSRRSPVGKYLGEGVELADLNSDGLTDIFQISQSKPDVRIWFNTGHGWSPEDTWSKPDGLSSLTSDGVRLADVNGDGMVDILLGYLYAGGRTIFYQYAWINNGHGWDLADEWKPPVHFTFYDGESTYNAAAAIADVNGDGLVDILLGGESVWINTGRGWEPSSDWGEIPIKLSSNWGIKVVDVNGDGLADILRGVKGTGQDIYDAWINNGHGWDQADEWKPERDFVRGSPNLYDYARLSDINGDGLVDTPSPDAFFINKGPNPGLLSKITNSLGGTTTIGYSPSTQFDNGGGDDVSDLGFPILLVSSITEDNGMPGGHHTSSTYSYGYRDGLYDYKDREFRGFGYVTINDPNEDYTEYVFRQDDAAKGKLEVLDSRDKDNNYYDAAINTWDSSTKPGGYYEVFLSKVEEWTFDGTVIGYKIKKTSYDYDDYGNVIEIIYDGNTVLSGYEKYLEIIYDGNTNLSGYEKYLEIIYNSIMDLSGDEKYLYNEYVYNPDNWIVDRLKHTELRDHDSTLMSQSWYYYDNQGLNDPPQKGDLTKEKHWLDTDTDPETDYVYDGYGNLVLETDPEEHPTQYVYESTHTFPIGIINAKDQIAGYEYDVGTGNLLSYTDPNGYVTTYNYDEFGRIEKEFRPYDEFPIISYEYQRDGSAPEGVKVSKRTLEPNTLDTYTFVDGLGRVVQTRRDAEDTLKQIVVDISYDGLGRVDKQYVPYMGDYSISYSTPSGSRFTRYIHDPVGRITRIFNPDNTCREMVYDHWKLTVTDENGHSKDYYMDAYNRILKVEEHNENTYTTTYEYNARDDLIEITDNDGNEFRFQYDSLSRKTEMTDPDMGVWRYSYDKADNLKSQTDNRGRMIGFYYDALNRITKIDYPSDSDVTYSYDKDDYDDGVYGTLTEVTDSTASIRYYYDQRLRKTREIKTIGEQSWTAEWTHDSADRVKTRKYPSSNAYHYDYNAQGELDNITDVINDIDYNALNKITGKDYGNGVYTGIYYDPDHFRLERIETPGLQDLSFVYDDVGNVKSITDSIGDKTQNFEYDDIDRLISASETPGYIRSYDYDSIGNIKSMVHDGNTMEFSYDGAGPHAITHFLVADAECLSGPCCDSGSFRSSRHVCDDEYQTEYGCPWGDSPGEDAGVRYKLRYCSGTSSDCDGVISDWTDWEVYEDCYDNEYCEGGECIEGCPPGFERVDLNDDHEVDMGDLFAITKSGYWGCYPDCEPGYEEFDLNDDGAVDMGDLFAVTKSGYWGDECYV